MKILSALVLVLLIAAPAAAQSTIFESLALDPEVPVAGEPVILTLSGSFRDGCWSLVSHDCGDIVDQEMVIAISSYDCQGRECGVCTLDLPPFEVTCEVVFPEAGTYVVHAEEFADTVRNPPPNPFPFAVQVEVIASVASGAPSWGTLKTLYR